MARLRHGVVTLDELLRFGFTRSSISRLVRQGRLVRLFPGVYCVDDPPRALAREEAALRYMPPGSALSHWSAALIWDVPAPRPKEVHVTCPSRASRHLSTLIVHSSTLSRPEVRSRNGLLVTSPERTGLDLSCELTEAQIRIVIRELIAQRLTTAPRLLEFTSKARGRRGARELRRLLLSADLSPLAAERRLARLIKSSPRLPEPRRNISLLGWEVDFYWPDAGFFVELDGGAVHSTPTKFESDRRRDAELQLRSIIGQRVTWRQITDEPGATISRIERGYALALARRP
jgi:very-short-patch-repair endonuclease